MAWHLLEKVIEHSAPHSTIFGKWWIAVMFVFRIIVVASIGDTVYSDEQDEFVCNTMQPGCKQVCYNLFAPISHIRFWAFQIIATGTPSVLFITYTMHKLAIVPNKPEDNAAKKNAETQTIWRRASILSKRSRDYRDTEKKQLLDDKISERTRSSNRTPLSFDEVVLKDDTGSVDAPSTAPPQYEKTCRETIVKNTKSSILRAYVVSVVVRLLIESGCVYAQYFMYTWSVDEVFECISYPCPKIVECYVSRPMEKTFFLYFMFVVGVVCIAINVAELHYLGVLKIRRVCKKKAQIKSQEQLLGTVGEYYPSNGLPMGRVIIREPTAPPGYYIPNVEPPDTPYKSPNNGFPPIRVRAASFTTSESDVTSDGEASSVGTINHARSKNSRLYL